MKITPIKLELDKPLYEQGTGKYNKKEIYPMSMTLLKRMNIIKKLLSILS